MLYLTTNCRAITNEQIQQTIAKHNFDRYIAISNADLAIEGVEVLRAPVYNIWNLFDSYIYTSTAKKFDCSPRFIVECAHYGKDVIYDIDYYDRALEVRKKDGLNGTSLTKDDAFLKLLDEQVKHRSD